MGAGKSTALQAARAEGLSTVEIDQLMEESFGSTIPQAFEAHGEEGFRAREAEVVGALLEQAEMWPFTGRCTTLMRASAAA